MSADAIVEVTPSVDSAESPQDSPIENPVIPDSFEQGDSLSPVIDGDLNFRENWFNDYADDPDFAPYLNSLPKYKSLKGLVKVAEDRGKQLSQRDEGRVKLLTAESTEEEVAAYRAAVGAPETAEGYEIATPEQLPEGLEFRTEDLEPLRQFAHDRNWTNEDLNALVNLQVQAEGAAIANIQAEQEAEKQALKDKWGNAWEQNNSEVDGAIGLAGGDLDHPALQHPATRAVIKELLDKGGFAEDSFVSGESAGVLSERAQASSIRTNPNDPLYGPYWNADGKYTSSEQEKAIETYRNLQRIADRRESKVR